MQTILLDFNTIIDPISLLSCLILFRQTHQNIYVRGESLIYEYRNERSRIPDNYGHLLRGDSVLVASTICKHPPDDLALQQNNLCLAIKLLRHAVDEGIVVVLDDHLLGEWARPEKSVSEQMIRRIPSFNYIDQHIFDGARYGSTYFYPETPQRYDDLKLALGQYWDATLGGRTFSRADLVARSQSKPMDFGYQGEAIHLLNPGEFREYTTLIDNPKLFSSISDATKTAVEDCSYHKKVRWFLPKYVFSKLTLGTSGLFEMLWIILKHQFDSSGQKGD